MKNKKIGLDNLLKLFFKTSLFILVALFLSKVFAYGYRILIARYFGAETYGLFSLASIVISFFAAIAALGLEEGISRYISYYRGKESPEKIKYLVQFSSRILIFS